MMRRAVSILLVLLFVSAPLMAKDDEVTPSDEANEYAKEFKKAYKKQTSAEVIEGVDKLVAFYKNEQVDDKRARKAILDCLKKATTVRDNVVVAHVMTKCGEMDDDVISIILPTLNRALDAKPPADQIYEAALEALGKLHSESRPAIKQLTDLLNYKDDSVVGRACRALAGYAGASGNTRKDLFEEVLKSTEGTYSASKNRDANAERKWNVIGEDAVDALNKLSGEKLADPAAARKWFNENKKRSWDKEG
jgi:hypothetical protein